MQILERIRIAFPDLGVPDPQSLVVFDGFDQLDKESAVAAFSGKTREQVRELVGKGATGWQGLWGVEELAFLEPPALRYYLEPFLTYLVLEEYADPQDVSFWLGYHLAELVARRGPEIFDRAQRETLVELAQHIVTQVTGYDDEWAAAHRRSYAVLGDRLGV